MSHDPFWDADAETGSGDPTAEIVAAYRSRLGRDPDQTELASEIENYGRYGGAQLNQNLSERAASNGGGGGGFANKAAMVSGPGGGGAAGANTFNSTAPQSIQPYGQNFSFNGAQVGQSDAFKFRFDKAMEAIQRSGAARGTLLNPQTLKALQDEASGLASQEYDAEYGRQADTFDRNFGVHQWNEDSRFNSQRANRLDDYSFMDSDRRFNRGVFENNRDFGYRQERDTVGDQWRFIDYGFNAGAQPR